MGGLRRTAEGDEPSALPCRSPVAEHPRVGGVAHRIEQGHSHMTVVNVVPARHPPGVAMVDRQDHLGSVVSDRPGQVGTQLQVGLHQAVAMIKKRQVGHADNSATAMLFLLAQRATLTWR